MKENIMYIWEKKIEHHNKTKHQNTKKQCFYSSDHISLLILKCSIVEPINKTYSALTTSAAVPKLFSVSSLEIFLSNFTSTVDMMEKILKPASQLRKIRISCV